VAYLRRDAGGLLVGVHDQQCPSSGEGVAQPSADRQLLGLLDGAAVDEAALLVIDPQHGLVPGAQPQRRLPFPLVGEAAGLGQLVAGPGLRQQIHRPAGADGGELAVVPDQQQLRPGRVDSVVDGGEVGGVGHRRLIHHHQIPGMQPPRLVPRDRARAARPGPGGETPLSAQPGRHVAGGEALGGEDFGRDLARGEPEHPPRHLRSGITRVGPGAGDGADHERLPRPSRPDQRLHPRTGRQHAVHGRGLVEPEPDPRGFHALQEPRRPIRR